MDTRRAAELQALLEGVPLPAKRDDLVAYASAQDPAAARELWALPDGEYDRLDAVADALLRRRNRLPAPSPAPKPESGEPAGGEDYLRAFPRDTGEVRHDAPPDNPPARAIEEQSKTQKRQAARQRQG